MMRKTLTIFFYEFLLKKTLLRNKLKNVKEKAKKRIKSFSYHVADFKEQEKNACKINVKM